MKSSNYKMNITEGKSASTRKHEKPKKNFKKRSNTILQTYNNEYIPLPLSLKSDLFFCMM